MANYVCRTCLYVCDNEFSFRRLEKVKHVLELFVPEIKTFVGKYSLICEQCYYFVKNVEKFKTKCIETHKKLYSMNIETIKDKRNAELQLVSNEPFRGPAQGGTLCSWQTAYQSVIKRSAEDSSKQACKQSKQNLNIPVTSTVTSENEITLASLLFTAAKPASLPQKQLPNERNATLLGSSVADDLLHLFNKDIADLRGFREFAVKSVNSNDQSKQNNQSNSVSTNNNDGLILNYDEDEEYMTRSDLVSAGILSDNSNKSTEQAESEGDDSEIIEMDMTDSNGSCGDNTGRVEFRISKGHQKKKKKRSNDTPVEVSINETECVSVPITATVKQEVMEDENPGFFNKKSVDGYYKCRLCEKQYKTSQGLYKHTKQRHGHEVKIHHCKNCSFFTLWKSSLLRHYSIFHPEILPQNNPLIKCDHCSFETQSKEQLSSHFMDQHMYAKFIRCNMCRSRFPDSISFTNHMKKEHLTLNSPQSSEFCVSSNKTFVLKEDYMKHITTEHWQTSSDKSKECSVIKEFCASCSKIFHSKDEYNEHQFKVHAAPRRTTR